MPGVRRCHHVRRVIALGMLALAAHASGENRRPIEGASMSREGPWTIHVDAVDGALARSDLTGAARAWQSAYLAAMGTWRWEGLVDVGDAALRIGRASGLGQSSVAKARNLYLTALYRARQQASVEGVLRVAEAFARLGDRVVAEQSVQEAERLAAEARDPTATARVRAFRTRLAGVIVPGDTVGP